MSLLGLGKVPESLALDLEGGRGRDEDCRLTPRLARSPEAKPSLSIGGGRRNLGRGRW